MLSLKGTNYDVSGSRVSAIVHDKSHLQEAKYIHSRQSRSFYLQGLQLQKMCPCGANLEAVYLVFTTTTPQPPNYAWLWRRSKSIVSLRISRTLRTAFNIALDIDLDKHWQRISTCKTYHFYRTPQICLSN